MEEDFLKKQKKILLKEKKELEKMLTSFAKKDRQIKGNWKAKFPELGGSVSEKEEQSDEVEEYINLLPIENRLELKLLDAKRALEKIEACEKSIGKILFRKKIKNSEKCTYGFCEKCGNKIRKERLKTIPETKFCSGCAKYT